MAIYISARYNGILSIGLLILFTITFIECRIHRIELEEDPRRFVVISQFGYLRGSSLHINVRNLSLSPDPEESDDENESGFLLVKTNSVRIFEPDPEAYEGVCPLKDVRKFPQKHVMVMTFNLKDKVVKVRCPKDKHSPRLFYLPGRRLKRAINITESASDTALYNKEEFSLEHPSLSNHVVGQTKKTLIHRVSSTSSSSSTDLDSSIMLMKDYQKTQSRYEICSNARDLPLTIQLDKNSATIYSFNFTMNIENEDEEGYYTFVYYNCLGGPTLGLVDKNTHTTFNLNVSIYEVNFPTNFLSAGMMPLPQLYMVFSVMFFLVTAIWINFINGQKEGVLKIHHLMSVLISFKALSLLFHGINYYNISRYGYPVVTWAYLYYATRFVKGTLFFITLVLIGSGWSFMKHMLSDKDKKIILLIVPMQIIAHIAEIAFDESTEGANELLAFLCSIVDLVCCIAILYPILWSIQHLTEASRTDGKAAINLRKLQLFKKFYIISTTYIYITRIMTLVIISQLSFKYLWLLDFFNELSTLIYFTITGYFFQPLPLSSYTLLADDFGNEADEEIYYNNDDTNDEKCLLTQINSTSTIVEI